MGLKTNYHLSIKEIDHQNHEIIDYEGLDSEIPKSTIQMDSNTIHDSKNYSIKYALVDHSVTTFAYAFIEKPRYGKFNPNRAIELNIPEGYLWKKLQEGQELEINGRIINPLNEGIIGPKKPGRKITYS